MDQSCSFANATSHQLLLIDVLPPKFHYLPFPVQYNYPTMRYTFDNHSKSTMKGPTRRPHLSDPPRSPIPFSSPDYTLSEKLRKAAMLTTFTHCIYFEHRFCGAYAVKKGLCIDNHRAFTLGRPSLGKVNISAYGISQTPSKHGPTAIGHSSTAAIAPRYARPLYILRSVHSADDDDDEYVPSSSAFRVRG